MELRKRMKKIYIKRFLSAVVLLCMIWQLYTLVNMTLVMKRTDGITTMQDYYVQPKGTIDVLVLGSSHAGMNIDQEVFWTNYGMSGYSLWGSIQPFWNTYYFLKEALKSQRPKVIILDMYAATRDFEYSDDARQVTNILGMKPSLNKLEAVMATAPRARWKDLWMGMPIYHSRYSELTKDDFMHYPWTKHLDSNKGSGYRYGTTADMPMTVKKTDERQPMTTKEEKYFRKIVETCKTEKIPLLLVTTPTAVRNDSQPYYNYVDDLAKELGLTFFNFNLMDEVIDFKKEDFYSDNLHVNTNGGRKVSKYIADYICTHSSYDYTHSNYGAAPMLATGKGTCQSYAALFYILGRYCGLQTNVVAGQFKTGSVTTNHTWNEINIQGKWMFVDLTSFDTKQDAQYLFQPIEKESQIYTQYTGNYDQVFEVFKKNQ